MDALWQIAEDAGDTDHAARKMATNWTSDRRRNACKCICNCHKLNSQSRKLPPIIMLNNKSFRILQIMIMTRTWQYVGRTQEPSVAQPWQAQQRTQNWKGCNENTIPIALLSLSLSLHALGAATSVGVLVMPKEPHSEPGHATLAAGAGNTQRHNSYNYGAWRHNGAEVKLAEQSSSRAELTIWHYQH